MAIPLVGSPPAPTNFGDLLTGNSSHFKTGLGSWTNSGGTLTYGTDIAYMWPSNNTGSAKLVTTANAHYLECPVPGTFKAGVEYSAFFVATVEENVEADFTFEIGVIGVDLGALAYPSFGTDEGMNGGNHLAFIVRWRPTANRTGVVVRVSRNGGSGTKTLHIAHCKVGRSEMSNAGSLQLVATPETNAAAPRSGLGLVVENGAQVTRLSVGSKFNGGLRFTQFGSTDITSFSGASGIYSGDHWSGVYVDSDAGDQNDEGFSIEVGPDAVGLNINEKDANTIQLYPYATEYDVELADRGTKTWRNKATDGGIAIPSQGMLPAYSTDPTGTERRAYWNTTSKTIRVHNGTAWETLAAGVGQFDEDLADEALIMPSGYTNIISTGTGWEEAEAGWLTISDSLANVGHYDATGESSYNADGPVAQITSNRVLIVRNGTLDNNSKIKASGTWHGIVLPVLSTDPSGPASEGGQMYFNSTSNTIRLYDTTSWTSLGTNSGQGLVDLLTGDSALFTSTIGIWTSSSGTTSWDNTVKFLGLNGSLKWVSPTTADTDYVEVPVSGTFESGREYHAVVALTMEEAHHFKDFNVKFGLIGTDSNDGDVYTRNPGVLSDGVWQLVIVRWVPTANRTGVTLRVTRGNATGAQTVHVGYSRVVPANGTLGLTMFIDPRLTSAGSPYAEILVPAGEAHATIISTGGYGQPATGTSPPYIMLGPGLFLSGGLSNDGAFSYLDIGATGSTTVAGGANDGDLNTEGIDVSVGPDALGFFIGQKNSDTVQFYGDWDDYHFEFTDGAAKGWASVDGAGITRRFSTMESRKGSGSATVASGSTSFVVTHGAGYTPVAQDIVVTPTNNPTNDPGWFWISTIGATQFTINVRNDPGSGGATFAWRVDR